MTQNIESDDVPVTRAFLSLVHILHNSRGRFVAETSLADDLGLPAPKDYWERCEDVFFNEFGDQFKAAGLASASCNRKKQSPSVSPDNFKTLKATFS